MDANEIVVHREQGHGIRVVLDLLGKGIREPSKAAGVHLHIQVRPFGKRRADLIRIGVTFDPLLIGTDALRWAVAARAFGGWFDFHRASDAIAIGALAVERALEPIADAIHSFSTPAPRNAAVELKSCLL